jgi:CRP/FNR family transcriptional regulator, nitrogen oxide reductase regulator
MFAVLGAIRKAVAYPVSAPALQDSSALAIKSTFMNEMMRTRPYLAMALTSLMAGMVQEIQVRYRELATERVEQRIARTLLRLAAQLGERVKRETTMVELSFTRQDLAEMTGTTLFTVSHTLSDWEKLGFIEAGRERIMIKNPHELVKIAEQTV